MLQLQADRICTVSKPAANSTFAIGGVPCFEDTFVQRESSVLRMNICGENPPIANLQDVVAILKITQTLKSQNNQYNMNPKVDFYFNKASKWQTELEQLRIIVLDCGLTEELKWAVPCYTFQNSNVVLIHDFKEYCAVLFVKGALLNDSHGILI